MGTSAFSNQVSYNACPCKKGSDNYNNDVPLTENSLLNNFPNPFNSQTIITYNIKEKTFVTLKVYDILGKEAAVLVSEEKEKGKYEVNFDSGNLSGGIYIYTLTAGKFIDSKKLILLK